ncbi:MAG: hypothetical protein ACOWWR_15950 [Eubacteriales bacterium]
MKISKKTKIIIIIISVIILLIFLLTKVTGKSIGSSKIIDTAVMAEMSTANNIVSDGNTCNYIL